MSVLKEKYVEGSVKDFAKELGYLVVKVTFNEGGYPDRLFISPRGLHVYIEFKREGELPEPRQNYRITELRLRNVIAFWTDSYAESVLALKAVLESPFVSEESDSTFAVASIRRAISRSGIRENLDRSGLIQNPEAEGPRKADAYRCAFTTSLQGLAG